MTEEVRKLEKAYAELKEEAASYAIVFLVILVIVTMTGITLMAIADYQANRGHPANRNPLLWIGYIISWIGVANLAFFGIGPKSLLITLIMGGVGFAFYEIALRPC
jgi:hypothetical protein